MYLLCPITYPASLVLNYFLGTTRGTIYKKAGLKCLVSMHQSDDMEGLTKDEVHIISSVLDLKDRRVCDVMIPMVDVFSLSIDTVLDKSLVNKILKNGYSRIPIKANNENRFIGMLLVKNLATYDHESKLTISQQSLSPLPETYPTTSCLDILKFFQEGKSHMALITIRPGGTPLGVITLEDVIENLIGKEIVDETDVFINVHKKTKVQREEECVRSQIQSRHSNYSQLSKTLSKESTGIKIRMNGYGAMVESKPNIYTHSLHQSNETYYHDHEPKL
ncbi:unnamed protein product [Rhizopus stolonifer]